MHKKLNLNFFFSYFNKHKKSSLSIKRRKKRYGNFVQDRELPLFAYKSFFLKKIQKNLNLNVKLPYKSLFFIKNKTTKPKIEKKLKRKDLNFFNLKFCLTRKNLKLGSQPSIKAKSEMFNFDIFKFFGKTNEGEKIPNNKHKSDTKIYVNLFHYNSNELIELKYLYNVSLIYEESDLIIKNDKKSIIFKGKKENILNLIKQLI